MFGIKDPSVWIAFLLLILCVLFSVWYGIKNWNKGSDDDNLNTSDDKKHDAKAQN